MKKALLFATALTAVTGVAKAADLPYAASPAPVAAPVFTWTGFYAGVNAGVVWADSAHPRIFDTETGVAVPFPLSTHNRNGVTVGGTVGYNIQFDSGFVAGVEADLAWANLDRKSDLAITEIEGGLPVVTMGEFSNKIEYFGTARARLGFAATPSLLIYATGGLAYADVKHSARVVTVDSTETEVFTGSASSTKWGYALGAGIEYALGSNWSLKGEYLYVGLPDTKYFVHDVSDGEAVVQVKEKNSFSTVRIGLNYRFSTY